MDNRNDDNNSNNNKASTDNNNASTDNNNNNASTEKNKESSDNQLDHQSSGREERLRVAAADSATSLLSRAFSADSFSRHYPASHLTATTSTPGSISSSTTSLSTTAPKRLSTSSATVASAVSATSAKHQKKHRTPSSLPQDTQAIVNWCPVRGDRPDLASEGSELLTSVLTSGAHRTRAFTVADGPSSASSALSASSASSALSAAVQNPREPPQIPHRRLAAFLPSELAKRPPLATSSSSSPSPASSPSPTPSTADKLPSVDAVKRQRVGGGDPRAPGAARTDEGGLFSLGSPPRARVFHPSDVFQPRRKVGTKAFKRKAMHGGTTRRRRSSLPSRSSTCLKAELLLMQESRQSKDDLWIGFRAVAAVASGAASTATSAASSASSVAGAAAKWIAESSYPSLPKLSGSMNNTPLALSQLELTTAPAYTPVHNVLLAGEDLLHQASVSLRYGDSSRKRNVTESGVLFLSNFRLIFQSNEARSRHIIAIPFLSLNQIIRKNHPSISQIKFICKDEWKLKFAFAHRSKSDDMEKIYHFVQRQMQFHSITELFAFTYKKALYLQSLGVGLNAFSPENLRLNSSSSGRSASRDRIRKKDTLTSSTPELSDEDTKALEVDAGWLVYDHLKEFERMGISTTDVDLSTRPTVAPLDAAENTTATATATVRKNRTWRVYRGNEDYSAVHTYPKYLCLPAALSDEDVRQCMDFRSKGRIPVLSWKSPKRTCTLTRCSQPLVGVFGDRNKSDEKLLRTIRKANDEFSDILYIVDARARVAAVGNKAKGAGHEIGRWYPNCTLEFMNIDNIHAIRESFTKLGTLIRVGSSQWLSSLESTGWLRHIHRILKASVKIALALAKGYSVLVHCSDGWDRTAQLCSLSQLMIDPYYRTLRGFEVLIEKEWLSFGHKFADRVGHQVKLRASPSERSPIFLQFLDCVHQMIHQFPTMFEFNNTFLMELADQSSSCRFGTFLCNSEAERAEQNLPQLTMSLWTEVNESADTYVNHLYAPPSAPLDYRQVLRPLSDTRHLRFWTEFFLRHQPTASPHIPLDAGGHHLLARLHEQQLELDTLRRALLDAESELERAHQLHQEDLMAFVEGNRRECREARSRATVHRIVKDILDRVSEEIASNAEEAALVGSDDEAEPLMFSAQQQAALFRPPSNRTMKRNPLWVPDHWVTNCAACARPFTNTRRRHHCRYCGKIFCHRDTSQRTAIPELGYPKAVRVCDKCSAHLRSTPKA